MDDIKLAGKTENTEPTWTILMKDVDLGEPTSFLDHVYLGCTRRQCEISKDIVDNYRTVFESRISAGRTEKLPCSENLSITSWSYDVEGHAKKCVERDIVANYRDMFESRISVGAKEKPPSRALEKLDAETISSWSYDMEGHAQKCVEIHCELANKTTQTIKQSRNAMHG